ncbi:MAG: DNA primase [Flavobacteriales bacterium]|nr:DNA primase [Flavobacteriales bacterium]
MIPKETIDRIFEASRVEEVIGDFVTLKRAGQNLKGLSPFVNEKTPSFVVSPAKQIWKDFSSAKGGNVVSFLMELENYTYPEALRYLARRYNIEIEEEQLDEEAQKAADEKESMYLVSEYAAKYFNETLLNSQRGKAIGLSYFKERGFREETIEKFRLGYCLDEWTAFTDTALAKGYNLEFLDSTGLSIVKDNGKKFDRFKGRVMFPIQSMSGRVLGFGGRTLLSDKKIAKYLNSPESLIYHKSNVLYGIYQAKSSIIKNDTCYLVEGYTDVISLHQTGIENVVASSGTALTPGQINLIKRFTPNITILYDGDSAGIKASFRGIDLILEQGMNVKVLTFPDGHDPDSFAKSVSTAELKTYLDDNASDFIQFKSDILLKDAENDPIKKAGLIREIVQSISKIDDRIKRQVYIQETSRLLNIQESILFDELAQIDNRELKKQNQQRNRQQSQPTQNPGLTIVPDDEPLPEMPGMPSGSFTPASTTVKKQLNIAEEQEKELMNLLLVYGDHEIEIIDEVEQEDEKGETELVKEVFKTTVLQEIVERLEEDGLSFSNEFFNNIFIEIVQGIENEEIRSSAYFIKHPDVQIATFLADVLSDKYELSTNWKRKDIFILSKEQRLVQTTEQTILRFKEKKITERIDKIAKNLASITEDMKRQEKMRELLKLNQLKILINTKLNRVL